MAFGTAFWTKKAPDLAIDLGTRNLLISNEQKILYQEPMALAGPLKQGVICNLDLCSRIIRQAVKKLNFSIFRKPRILISAPLDITPIEKEAFRDVALRAGSSEIDLVPEPMADAVGLIPNFSLKKGIVVVDIGAGISEAVLFSMGGIVANFSQRMGGADFENALTQFIRKKYYFDIGHSTVLELLNLMSHHRNEAFLAPIEVKGMDLARGIPSTVFVEMTELDRCLDPLFSRMVELLRKLLEVASPDLCQEIIYEGIFLTGGASQFPRLHEMIKERLGLQTNLDAQPFLGVARGEILLLQKPELLARLGF